MIPASLEKLVKILYYMIIIMRTLYNVYPINDKVYWKIIISYKYIVYKMDSNVIVIVSVNEASWFVKLWVYTQALLQLQWKCNHYNYKLVEQNTVMITITNWKFSNFVINYT